MPLGEVDNQPSDKAGWAEACAEPLIGWGPHPGGGMSPAPVGIRVGFQEEEEEVSE